MQQINQIFDKAFKRILTLSDKTVINLINGLFSTTYATTSKVTYNWTEYEDMDLKKTLSDSILTINNRNCYHVEVQMTEDEEIVFRAFEYGFGHAYKNRVLESGEERMVFPRPCIIYLDAGKKEKIPDEYTLILEFEGQGEYTYKVPVVKLQNISIKELNDKKLIALFPFLLLKLRKKIQKRRTQTEIDELQKLIIDDILWTIDRNEEVGNISPTDAYHLKVLTNILYMQIYSEYKELEELTVKLYDQSLELPADKYEKTVEDLQEEVEEMKGILEEKDASLKEKDASLKEKDAGLKEKDAKLKELEERIKELEKIVETK